ncbi:hypothetical protein AN639_00520 [Candidatus Epulonipiscium fishelsonii]|uniref:Uncharacterized protein n=1 Tax=Candidatus Epulonipiscium fishelsonii TaxID=77094 RepID=A0ACC8XBE8_9FIRM|nr:hypothetical protein AN396_07180 [Epulopiscium sp. SCG-B11WGA-EpuloA1]ONI41284.1 hypothetical protein AN639_00520 [Epulopiscium sp. SCG-B05WGA-EpuloA1]
MQELMSSIYMAIGLSLLLYSIDTKEEVKHHFTHTQMRVKDNFDKNTYLFTKNIFNFTQIIIFCGASFLAQYHYIHPSNLAPLWLVDLIVYQLVQAHLDEMVEPIITDKSYSNTWE